MSYPHTWGFPSVAVVKNPLANAGDSKDAGSISWFWKIPWRKKWQPISIFLPEKSHGQRSLAGYSPWGLKELDVTEHAQVVPVGVVQSHFLRSGVGRLFLQGGCRVCQ